MSDIGEGEQAGSGELVHLSGVPVSGQRGDGHVGYVGDVDERLGDVRGRQRNYALQHGLEEEVLTEVLREPARAQDRPLHAGIAHRLFTGFRIGLATPGQQHQPAPAAGHSHLRECADAIGRARE